MRLIIKPILVFLIVVFAVNCCAVTQIFADEFSGVGMSFDGYITNEVPTDVSVTGAQMYIKEYTSGNKGLLIACADTSATLSVNASCGVDFVVSFEIVSAPDGFDGKLTLTDGSHTFAPLSFHKDDCSVRTHDNKKIGAYKKDSSTRIDIAVRTTEKKYDVYINRKLSCENWYTKDMTLTKLSTVKISANANAEGGYVVFDNINLHDGALPLGEYPREPYNEETTEPPSLDSVQVGDLVITNERFEGDSLPFTKELGGNLLAVKKDENGNGVLSIEKLTEKRGLFASSLNTGEMDRVVIEYKIKLLEQNSNFDLCVFKSEGGSWSTNINVRGGVIYGLKGAKRYTLPCYIWTKVSAVFCISGKYFDLYINDELLEEKISWQNAFSDAISEVRFSMAASTGKTNPAKLYIDDYRVYEGAQPRDIPDDFVLTFPPNNILPSTKTYDSLMNGRVGLHLKSGVLYANGKRTECDVKPYISNDRTMVPVRAVSEAFGLKVTYNNETKEVTVGDNIRLTIGKNEMFVGGSAVSLECAPEITNGRTFLPLRDLCEKGLLKNVYYDDSCVNGGMIVVGDKVFTPPGDQTTLQGLNDYLLFVRPSQDWLVENLSKNGYENVHPRMLITRDDVEKLKYEIETNEIKASWAKQLFSNCESYKKKDLPVYNCYNGTNIDTSGAREAEHLAFAYLLTGDKSYVEAAWKKLEAICAWSDWNPDREFLNNAQVAMHTALAYDWMYDALTEEQRKTIEQALYDKCIMEAKKWWYGIKGPKDKWQIAQANWNPVCNSGVGIGCLAVLDVYPEEAGEILSLNIRGLEYISRRFAPDGAWFEGPAYWDFVFKKFTVFLDALEGVYDTVFALDTMEGLEKAATTILYMQSSYGTYNYADAEVQVVYPVALYYLSNHFNEPSVTAITLEKTDYKVSGERIPYGLIWLDVEKLGGDSGIMLPYDNTFGGSGAFGVMRDSWTDDNGTYAGIKAGKAVDNHSHLDLGSFIFETGGQRWAIDLGKDSYFLPDYWASNKERWRIYRLRAEGHNTLVINPDETGIDQNLKATAHITEQKSSEKGAITIVDLSEAYCDNAESAKRGFFLTDNRKSLVVRDEIKLKAFSDEIYWSMHTQADSATINGNSVIISSKGKNLLVEFLSSTEFEIMFTDAKAMEGTPTVAGEDANAGIKKLMLRLKGEGDISITAKLTPVDIMASDISEYDIPIDAWQLPEGKINTQVYLPDKITVGDAEYINILENDRNIVINYVEGVSELPEVNAESSRYKCAVVQAKSFSDMAKIKVYNESGDYYTQCTVSFRKIPAPIQIEGYDTMPVFSVEASAVPQVLNHEYNVLDADYNTRWSATNSATEPAWLKLDMQKVTEIDTLFMSLYSGDTRKTTYKVLVSEDGQSYTEVYSGKTTGTTAQFEKTTFAKCRARYVKIEFFGNDDGEWNSPTEVLIAKEAE